MFGFDNEIRAVIIGATGGLGKKFVEELCASPSCSSVWIGVRNEKDVQHHSKLRSSIVDITKEDTIRHWGEAIKEANFQPNFILNCCGLLHGENGVKPEKTWRHLNSEQMSEVFAVNAFGVALLAKHIIPCIPRTDRSIFASISARVGSISDNYLGGWYSYRASKAAHNMMIKTLSIEAQRKRKELICVSLHPGTVDTRLSAPFTKGYDSKKLFSPQQSCSYLSSVLADLHPKDSGGFFAWDGCPIPF